MVFWMSVVNQFMMIVQGLDCGFIGKLSLLFLEPFFYLLDMELSVSLANNIFLGSI